MEILVVDQLALTFLAAAVVLAVQVAERQVASA
jgi:hypothetical protein